MCKNQEWIFASAEPGSTTLAIPRACAQLESRSSTLYEGLGLVILPT